MTLCQALFACDGRSESDRMSPLCTARRTRVTEEATSTVSPQWADVKVARETVIQRWDRRHRSEPLLESVEAGEIRMYRPLEPGPAASETVTIGGSGVYSSPFRDDGRGETPWRRIDSG